MELRSGKKLINKTINEPKPLISPIRKYLTSYNNRTNFLLVHKNNFVMNQKWIHIEGLKINTANLQNVGNRFSEYFLETNSPIKAAEWNGKYWIIDGHHRFLRGLIMNYNYFLIECNDMYHPCNLEETSSLNVFDKRYPDVIINNESNITQINQFSEDLEEILSKFTEIFPNIPINKYIVSSEI